ncbi:MAG: DUF1896 domain-containing protein [Prevotellaceae bacterium]|jgi:hypothetical protein|nr:DUF1896 domain-containing protein [Prevotellaceae bacterium]
MATIELDSLDCYQQSVFRYLKDYHPYVFDDKEEADEIIVMRANNAVNAYKTAACDGESPYECERIAMQTLYAGLEFSPITYLIEACQNATGYEMSSDEACEIYRDPSVKEIFSRYGTEIEGDPREYRLVAELEPCFHKYKDHDNPFAERYF